jgi:peptide/nickel transport system substrate-binding protein
MGMTRSRVATLTVVLAMLGSIVLSGTAQAQSSTPSARKIVFRIGTPTDMISPNPLKAVNGPDYETLFDIYDLLFNFAPKDLLPAPGLATKCDHSTDFITWTCTIRSGVKWSDGVPLTAEDIAFTYRFMVDTDYPGNDIFTSSYLPYSPTFSAPNATTLVWTSKKPTFAPTVPPWIPILPEHIWKKYEGHPTAAQGFKNVPAVGSGPFVLKSWTPKQSWTMEANKSYWGGTPTIDEVQYIYYTSQEAMVQALKAGEIDFADNLNPTLFNSLKGQSNIGLVTGTPSTFANLAFNFGRQDKVDPSTHPTDNPVIRDPKFRLAVTMGINKQEIVNKVWQGYAQAGSVVTLPSRTTWFYKPTDLSSQAYNPTAANALLDQAGYDKKDSNGIRLDKSGKPIELNILSLPEETGSVETGQIIQAELQQIGIGVKLKPVSDSKATDLWYDGDFDAYIWGWGGDPDPNFIMSIFTTSQCLGWSDGCYSEGEDYQTLTPSYDEMFKQSQTLIDPSGTGRGPERVQFLNQMQQRIFTGIPEIVLDYPDYLEAYRTDTFAGYVAQPSNGGTYLFSFGPYSLINLKPVSATAGSGSSGGVAVGVWIALAAAIVVAIVLFLLTSRRRKEEEA